MWSMSRRRGPVMPAPSSSFEVLACTSSPASSVDLAGALVDDVGGDVACHEFARPWTSSGLDAVFAAASWRARGVILRARLRPATSPVSASTRSDGGLDALQRSASIRTVLQPLRRRLLVGCTVSVEGAAGSSSRVASARARGGSAVTGSLRRRSMRTYTMSLASNSKSSHEPRYGITRAANRQLARGVGLALVVVEEHARRAVHLAETMTRSVPLMMKVPFVRHERHVAHVDVLLLDVAGRSCAPVSSSDLEHDQAQRRPSAARR